MDWIEILGFVASGLATLAFLPQAMKTWITRSARDFSLPTLLMLVAGAGLWTVYGSMRAAPPRFGSETASPWRWPPSFSA